MANSLKSTRMPAVAGMFYPDNPEACRRVVGEMFNLSKPAHAPGKWLGALLPHAGWICSGQVAVNTLVTLAKDSPQPDIVVIFGAVHTVGGITYGALDEHARWLLPSGESDVAMSVQEQLLEFPHDLRVDSRVHYREHAIEVELPLIQKVFPQAMILPVEIPPIDAALRVGRQIAQTMQKITPKVIYLASSDLTHYGINYNFAPAGLGIQGIQWAMKNDQRLLDLIGKMRADHIVQETQQSANACGGGAIAAMLTACQVAGADQAIVLEHTNSYQTLARIAPQSPDNSVGYAGVLVG